jgi:hypothetical protein
MRKQGRRTFRMILDQVEAENYEKIMEHARRANRLAKLLEGPSRSKAYRIKHRALKGLASSFPHLVYVHIDRRTPGFVLVDSLTRVWGLHAPYSVFEAWQQDCRAA